MVLPTTWKAAGNVAASISRDLSARTTTDDLRDIEAPLPQPTAKRVFDYGKALWLCDVARDAELSGATLRTAVLLWQLLNSKYGYAWPSLTYIAAELKMHKSTVIRSLHILRNRGWITITHRGGRHRTNQYRIGFGRMDDSDTAS
jgi:hypothetical protein